MKILHKYLLKEVGLIFFLTLFFSSFLFMLRYLFVILSHMSEFSVPFFLAWDYFICVLPDILFMTFPIAALISSMVALGRFSSDKEIIALSANGVNLASFVSPLIIISLLVSLGIFAFTQIYLPKVRLHETAVNQLLIFKSVENIPVGRVWPLGEGFMAYIGGENENTGRLQKIALLKQIPEEEEALFIVAESGLIEPDFEQFVLNIQLFNGSIHQNDRRKLENYYYGNFDQLDMNISFSVQQMEDGIYEKRMNEMTNTEIRNIVNDYRNIMKNRMQESGLLPQNFSDEHWLIQSRWLETNEPKWWDDRIGSTFRRHNRYLEEITKRHYRSFSTFIFCFIAVGLGIQLHPRSRSWGFIFSMILYFLYYFLREMAEAVILTGTRYPFLVAWGPNILFIALGGYLLYRLSRW